MECPAFLSGSRQLIKSCKAIAIPLETANITGLNVHGKSPNAGTAVAFLSYFYEIKVSSTDASFPGNFPFCFDDK